MSDPHFLSKLRLEVVMGPDLQAGQVLPGDCLEVREMERGHSTRNLLAESGRALITAPAGSASRGDGP